MKFDKSTFALIMMAFGFCLILSVQIHYELQLNDYQNRLQAFNATKNLSSSQFIGGYYFGRVPGYYCVYTKGLSAGEIADHDVHEKCHALVNSKKKHFCG